MVLPTKQCDDSPTGHAQPRCRNSTHGMLRSRGSVKTASFISAATNVVPFEVPQFVTPSVSFLYEHIKSTLATINGYTSGKIKVRPPRRQPTTPALTRVTIPYMGKKSHKLQHILKTVNIVRHRSSNKLHSSLHTQRPETQEHATRSLQDTMRMRQSLHRGNREKLQHKN